MPGPVALLSIVALSMMPAPASSQVGVTVQGRVFEEGGGVGIPDAVVELEGVGFAQTAEDGSFRFLGVEPGGYSLGVLVMGYAPDVRLLRVEGEDIRLEIGLEIAPVLLDPLVVNARLVELEGIVRDREHDFPVVHAEVLTSQGIVTDVDSHGRYSLETLPAGVPVFVTVRAFGYLPVDTFFLPEEGREYRVELDPDPVTRAMVEVQVERLEERIGAHFAIYLPPMNRDEIVRYAGGATLMGALLMRYGKRLDDVRCLFVDDRQLFSRYEWRPALEGLLPEEVERVDFWAFGGRLNGLILQVYTADFMQQLTAGQRSLRRPYALSGTFFCV
jgi:hypothetical protein